MTWHLCLHGIDASAYVMAAVPFHGICAFMSSNLLWMPMYEFSHCVSAVSSHMVCSFLRHSRGGLTTSGVPEHCSAAAFSMTNAPSQPRRRTAGLAHPSTLSMLSARAASACSLSTCGAWRKTPPLGASSSLQVGSIHQHHAPSTISLTSSRLGCGVAGAASSGSAPPFAGTTTQ